MYANNASSPLFSDDSLSFDLISKPFLLQALSNWSITAVIIGAPDGYLTVQGCNDIGSKNDALPIDDGNLINWFDIHTVRVVEPNIIAWEKAHAGLRWIRLTYTWISGDGLITANANAKS